MSPGIEPRFLTRETVDAIHEEQIDTYGGLHGVRDENALKSAIAAAQNVYHYGGGDMYEVAAAYAYHLAESQAYFDGNKRTGVQAALVFLEACGVDTDPLQARPTYDLMIKIAVHGAGRSDLADYLRSELGQERMSDRRELPEGEDAWRGLLKEEKALRQAEQRPQEQQERGEGPNPGEGGREP